MRAMNLRFLSAESALCAAALAACTPASGTTTTGNPAPATATAATSAAVMATAPTPPAPSAGPVEVDDLVGKPAPDFTSVAQDGTSVHLAALRGKAVVVYFYPKDETPGCTKEACSFRDAWQELSKTGAVLVGVSADTTASHKDFVAHYKLPFLLLSDPDGALGRLYGVPFDGHHRRQTVVIGRDGTVRKVYRQVDVMKHAQEILGDIGQLS